jgi:hypothetical protein
LKIYVQIEFLNRGEIGTEWFLKIRLKSNATKCRKQTLSPHPAPCLVRETRLSVNVCVCVTCVGGCDVFHFLEHAFSNLQCFTRGPA